MIPVTQRPLFSILHTSARPQAWKLVYDAWLTSCKNPQAVEYVLVIDRKWGFTELPTLRPQDKVLWQTGNGYVDGVNLAAEHSTGLILCVNADDQFPCIDWDTELVKLVPQCTDFVISVSTGTPSEHERGIMVAPILSRPRYEKYGYVFYPKYISMYADNDFYESAVMDKALVDGRGLLFPHWHPISDPTITVDAQYMEMNRPEAYKLGENVLTTRRLSQFGRKSERQETFTSRKPLVMETPSTQRKRIAVALPGEHFSSAWVSAWVTLQTYLMSQFALEVVFTYSSNVYATRQTIWNTFRDLRPQPDYLLWIDDDNIVTPENIMQLLRDLDSSCRADIVAGWCWIAADVNQVPAKTSVGVFDASGIPRHLRPDEFSVLTSIGFTGFPLVLMRGELLNAPGLGDTAFAPIHAPVYKGGYTGEDVSFCIRATQAGATILVDSRVKVPHLKLRAAEPLPEVRNESAVA